VPSAPNDHLILPAQKLYVADIFSIHILLMKKVNLARLSKLSKATELV